MCNRPGCDLFRRLDGMGNDACMIAVHPRWTGEIQMLYAGQYPMPAPDGSYFENGVLYNSNGQIEQYGSNTTPQAAWNAATAAGDPIAAPPQIVYSGPPYAPQTFGMTFGSSGSVQLFGNAVSGPAPTFGVTSDSIPKTQGSVVIGRYRTAEIPRTPTLPRLCCIEHKCDAKVHWWSYTENELVRSTPTGRPQNMHFWRAWIECNDQHMWIHFFFPEKTFAIEFLHDETEHVGAVYEETAVLERLIDDYAERIKAQRKFLKKRGAE